MARSSRSESGLNAAVSGPGGSALEAGDLLLGAQSGNRAALARLLTMVERGSSLDPSVVIEPFVVGITGAPGAGKSSLVAALVGEWRRRGQRIALLLVDPSSPVSGGAVLGDRVRLSELSMDDGVYCRSVATRGHLGGLTARTAATVSALGSAGWPLVIIETVGVGQVEVEIMGIADVTTVVLTPGMGDSIQAAKAGLMEIGDVYVLNKADLAGIGQLRRDVASVLALTSDDAVAGDRAPIYETAATLGTGVAELVDELAGRFHAWESTRVENPVEGAESDDHAGAAGMDGRRSIDELRLQTGGEDSVGTALDSAEALTDELNRRWSAYLEETRHRPEFAELVRSIADGVLTIERAADLLISFDEDD